MHKPRPEEPVGLYPMRLVTRLTGLSADTIRAWERRHGAVRPSRSAGNTRRFSADEVRRLVLLREATEGGHSIRSIAPLGLKELERLVERRELPLSVVPPDVASAQVRFRELRHAYIGALTRFDVRRAFDLLMRCATTLDRSTFVFEVVIPAMREVGGLGRGQVRGGAHAQVVDGQVRAVLMALLRLSPPPAGAPRLLLTTPEPQDPEARLLVAAILATAHGADPVYVGPGLPAEEIEWAARMGRADVAVLAADQTPAPDDLAGFASLSERLRPGIQVWCVASTGHPLRSAVPMDLWFDEFESFADAVKGFTEAH